MYGVRALLPRLDLVDGTIPLCVLERYNTKIPSSLTVAFQPFTCCERGVGLSCSFIPIYLFNTSCCTFFNLFCFQISTLVLHIDEQNTLYHPNPPILTSSSLSAAPLKAWESKQVLEQRQRRQRRLLGQSHATSAAIAHAGWPSARGLF